MIALHSLFHSHDILHFGGRNRIRHAALNQILNISFVNVSLLKFFVWRQDASVILTGKWSSTKDHPIGSSHGVNNTKFQYNVSHTCGCYLTFLWCEYSVYTTESMVKQRIMLCYHILGIIWRESQPHYLSRACPDFWGPRRILKMGALSHFQEIRFHKTHVNISKNKMCRQNHKKYLSLQELKTTKITCHYKNPRVTLLIPNWT